MEFNQLLLQQAYNFNTKQSKKPYKQAIESDFCVDLDLKKSKSESPTVIHPLFLHSKATESQVVGDYINFVDDDQTMCCSSNERCEEHCFQMNEAQIKALEDHTKKIGEFYTQMINHVQICNNSFCNFIYLCPKFEELIGKPMDMDLPQIGYFNLNGYGEQTTFSTLCEYGKNLNRLMKEEFIDFMLL
ncbi:hypothetical protein ABPG74_016610 [Tetrahymena malaccensis]